MLPLTQETAKVISKMNWVKTKKDIIKEFFDLKEEVIYDDKWVNIRSIINDFIDLDILIKKKVKYNDTLLKLWVNEEEFKSYFKNLPLDNGEQTSNTKSWKAKAK